MRPNGPGDSVLETAFPLEARLGAFPALDAAMRQAGAVRATFPGCEDAEDEDEELARRLCTAVGEHLGLSLPRREIEQGLLPAVHLPSPVSSRRRFALNGSSLARSATTQAAESASLQVGKELTARAGRVKLPSAVRMLLADPAAVTVEDGHPLDSHSARGLTAFYYALVLYVPGRRQLIGGLTAGFGR